MTEPSTVPEPVTEPGIGSGNGCGTGTGLHWWFRYRCEIQFRSGPDQGAGKRPAAQEKQIMRASPEGRCPRPEGPIAADAARFFFFFFFFFQRPLYKNVVICKNRDFRVLF